MTSSSSPQRRSAATPGAWITWVETVSLGNVARSTTQHPVALAGQQHRGRRAGAAGADDDRVVGRWPCRDLRTRRCLTMRPTGRGIGEVPYSAAGFVPGGVRGGLGPAAQAELGEDVADVVLDGLAADVEALGDLGVGQAVAEQVEHLGLALGQQAAARAWLTRCGRRASAAARRRRRRGGPPRAARTPRARRAPRPSPPRAARRRGRWRARAGSGRPPSASAPARSRRAPRAGTPADRRRRRPGTPAPGQRGGGQRGSGSAVHARAQASQLHRRPHRPSSMSPAARWTSTSSASSGAAAALVRSISVERPLEHVGGQRRLAAREVDRGDGRAASTDAAIEAVEQLLGLLEPALADAQVGQADERAAAQRPCGRVPRAAPPRSAPRRPRATARRR